MAIYNEELSQTLDSAERDGSELELLLLICVYLKNGAFLRWGLDGWEMSTALGTRTPSTIVLELARLGLIESREGLLYWAKRTKYDTGAQNLARRVEELFFENSSSLNPNWRRVLRTHQRAAYFAFLREIAQLHGNLTRDESEPVDYPSKFRQQLRFWYLWIRLYGIGMLHFLTPVPDHFGVRSAQDAIRILSELTPGAVEIL